MTEEQEKILLEYVEYLRSQKRPHPERVSTLKTFFQYLNLSSIDFTSMSITEAYDVQKYLVMRVKPEDGTPYYASVTVVTMMGRIRSFYEYLKMRKLVLYNPFNEINRVRGEKVLPRDILTPQQMGKALGTLRDFISGETSARMRMSYKAHVVAELMYSTGARIHEIVRLRVEDVDFTRNVVLLRDRKTGAERYGILNQYAVQVLRIYIDEMRDYILTKRSNDELLFGSKNNLRRWINEMMNEACQKHAFPHFTSHVFRHCMGSHLLQNGCDIRYIQELLGHESIESTQIYTRVVKEDLRRVIDQYHPRSYTPSEGEGV